MADCLKVHYEDRKEAHEATLDIYTRERDVLDTYYCRNCFTWHIGHTGPGRTKILQRRLEKQRRKDEAAKETRRRRRHENHSGVSPPRAP